MNIIDYIEERYAELSRICGEDQAEVPGWKAEGAREELKQLYDLLKKQPHNPSKADKREPCEVCRRGCDDKRYKFCPNCGAPLAP